MVTLPRKYQVNRIFYSGNGKIEAVKIALVNGTRIFRREGTQYFEVKTTSLWGTHSEERKISYDYVWSDVREIFEAETRYGVKDLRKRKRSLEQYIDMKQPFSRWRKANI